MDVTEYGCCNRLDDSQMAMLSEHKSIPSDAHDWKHRTYIRAMDYHESGNVSSTSSSTARDYRHSTTLTFLIQYLARPNKTRNQTNCRIRRRKHRMG